MSSQSAVKCDYCGNPARLVGGDVIYPHRPDLYTRKFWNCELCGAYVGCHECSDGVPMGRLANAELRAAKRAAHVAFDPIWRSGEMTRTQAYAWLAETLGMSQQSCHIGMFDIGDCERVIAACGRPAVFIDFEELLK